MFTIAGHGLLLRSHKRKEIFEMTISPSKQKKKQGLILASITLIGVLVTFGPLNGSMYSSIRNALLTQGSAAGEVSINNAASFASDLQYWDAKCSRGWTSDSTCDVLVSRTQSCVVGIGTYSAYCSEYDTYLQQFRGR